MDPIWLSLNPSKRWAEIFFLNQSILWISVFILVVGTKVYENFGDMEYLTLGLFVSLPFVLYPTFFPCEADKKLPWNKRYWVKANIWIAILSYVGNYFWTHYFYKVLGAKYTFPITWELNRVPLMLYFITHAYFCTYHAITTILLRRFWSSHFYKKAFKPLQIFMSVMVVFLMGYSTAFMEAFSISSVPYYSYPDAKAFYLIGSAFYGIYFYVSFPMFYHLDEELGTNWTIGYTVINSLAACMLVTMILDAWRLIIGGLVGTEITQTLPHLI